MPLAAPDVPRSDAPRPREEAPPSSGGPRGAGIRSRWDLLRICAGSMSSTVGFRTLGVTYPLLALSLTNSPVHVGWAGFALTLPTLLFYVPAGLLVDRMTARAVMAATEAARLLAVASVFLAVVFGGVTLPHLLAAAFVEGTFWVVYSLAETALIRSAVPRASLVGMLATSETSSHVAVMAARPVGGFLFGLGHCVPFVMNTLLFFASLLAVLTLPGGGRRRVLRTAAPGRGKASFLQEMTAGVGELRSHRFLRNAMALTTVTNLMINMLIIVFVAGSVTHSPLEVGLVLAASGLGGVLGSALAPALRRLLRHPLLEPRLAPLGPPREILLFAHMWIWAFALLIPVVGESPVFFGAALFLMGCAGALSNMSVRAFEIDRVAEGKLARVVSVHRLTTHGAVCLAAPLGGFLVSAVGVPAATRSLFLVMSGIALSVAAVVPLRRVLRSGTTAASAVPGRIRRPEDLGPPVPGPVCRRSDLFRQAVRLCGQVRRKPRSHRGLRTPSQTGR
ncbi:MFS transporter [Planomonospora parontospora subsp. antibiotica]|nr:MFS transporter [Planomonospora parontospora subsp. antibiotica]GII17635.1 MFS transporter [Planomonospora parontospora subsp. antibiotica]